MNVVGRLWIASKVGMKGTQSGPDASSSHTAASGGTQSGPGPNGFPGAVGIGRYGKLFLCGRRRELTERHLHQGPKGPGVDPVVLGYWGGKGGQATTAGTVYFGGEGGGSSQAPASASITPSKTRDDPLISFTYNACGLVGQADSMRSRSKSCESACMSES